MFVHGYVYVHEHVHEILVVNPNGYACRYIGRKSVFAEMLVTK